MLNNTEQKSEPNCWVQLQSTITFHLLESNFVPKRAFKENRVIRWRDAQRETDGGPQVGEVNPPGRGRKWKCVYMQSYNPEVLGWGFLRLLLRLQLGSLSAGVPSSHLEKDERLIIGHVCTYSWKRHALCYAVLGYARNRRLNTLQGMVWETK